MTIDRVSIDSRSVRPGDLFWALPGKRFDGHDFVAQAFDAGARAAVMAYDRGHSAALSEERRRRVLWVGDSVQSLGRFAAYYRRTCKATVIGITGSVGKTSTREAIYAVLSQQWPGIRSLKNYNNEIGVPLSLLELSPDDRFAVIEMGASGAGEIARLTELAAPQIGVLTAIGAVHLEGFGSIEGVALAKSELIHGLGTRGTAFLNADDYRIQAIGQSARCGVVWYGIEEDPCWLMASARQITAVGDSVTFRLDSGQRVRLTVAGRHQVYAAMAAVAVGRWLGLSDRRIIRGLGEYRPAAMRCEVERYGRVTVINDAYNSSPPSMIAALDMFCTWPVSGRRVLVCGDMLELGAQGVELHRRLGEEIARRPAISRCIAVGPLSAYVVEAARRAGMSDGQIIHCDSTGDAADQLGRMVCEGDAVLIKASRAMQLEQTLAGLQRAA